MASDYQEIKQKTIGLKYAINGLVFAFKNEINMRVHVLFTVSVIILGFIFHVSLTEWVLLFLTFGLVLSSEVFNTAVEMLLDYLAPEWHPKVGIIKDLTAGGVLVASGIALVIGSIIFIPKLLALFL
jgi:undecaprenol kinase/diacylglycerol kinase (ATP)